MTEAEVRDAVICAVFSNSMLPVGIDDVQDEEVLTEDLGMDSLDILLVSTDVEDAIGMKFHDWEVESWRTVGDIVECTVSKAIITPKKIVRTF